MDNRLRKIPTKAVCLLIAGILIGIGGTIAVVRMMQHNAEPANVQLVENAQSGADTTDPSALPPPIPNEQTGPPDIPPGRFIEFGKSTSGYAFATGRKAVDSDAPIITGGGGDVVVSPGPTEGYVDGYNRPITRNGLIGNPCVDPPSSHGAAYSRSY